MNMNALFLFLIFCVFIPNGIGIKCYMCSSASSPDEDDSCGAYTKFDKEQHIAIECNSEESPMPGSFCIKMIQQGIRGFIWDGRWRQVIRRCASVADTGVTGVCNWGVYDNGVYWEECNCTSDECNSAFSLSRLPLYLLLLIAIIPLIRISFYQ